MSSPIRTILVATDGSDDAAVARRAAADLATATHAQLHLVTAWDTVAYAIHYPGVVIPPEIAEAEEAGAVRTMAAERKVLDEQEVRVAGEHVVGGPAGRAIVRLADRLGADLVVAGSRGLGPIGRLVMGSVSEELVNSCSRPVLLLRGGPLAWPPRRIVAGWDGSPDSRDASCAAARLGAALGVPVVLLLVVSPHGGRHDAGDHAAVGDTTEALSVQLTAQATALHADTGATVVSEVVVDHPAAGLLAAAGEEPGRIVLAMGHGRGRSHHLFVGSVTSKILHGSQVPVLVVPHRTGATARR